MKLRAGSSHATVALTVAVTLFVAGGAASFVACGSGTNGDAGDAGAGGFELGDGGKACATSADCPSGSTCAPVRIGELSTSRCVPSSEPDASSSTDAGLPTSDAATSDAAHDALAVTDAGALQAALTELGTTCFDLGAVATKPAIDVATPEALANLSSGEHYRLTADVDMTGIAPTTGRATTLTNVVIEGNGKAVKDLRSPRGLLGSAKCVVVRELTLDAPSIRPVRTATLAYAGALFDVAERVHVTDVAVTNGTITVGGPEGVGVGFVAGSAQDSWIRTSRATGRVDVDLDPGASLDSYVTIGGLVGSAYATTIADGTTTIAFDATMAGTKGGIVGDMNDGSITGCTSAGTIRGRETNYRNEPMGGIAGYVTTGSVKDCRSTVAIESDVDYPGGIAGILSLRAAVERCTYEGALVTGGQFAGGIVAALYGSSTVVDSRSKGTCRVRGGGHAGGIAGTTYRSTDASRLERVRSEMAITTDSGHGGGIVGLADGVVLTRAEFTGTVTSGASAGGILGRVTGATIHEAAVLAGASITGTLAGGLVGEASRGNVDDVATIDDAYVRGSVTGSSSVAGFVGQIATAAGGSEYVTIRRAYSDATLTGAGTRGGLVVSETTGATGVTNAYFVGAKAGTTSGPGTSIASGDLATMATFVGFDFATVWNAPTSAGPTLRWP
ncbi:MAG: hypothetical protein U0169_07195 [Polyangiaceae bacterium]